jgi:hypothetical protein
MKWPELRGLIAKLSFGLVILGLLVVLGGVAVVLLLGKVSSGWIDPVVWSGTVVLVLAASLGVSAWPEKLGKGSAIVAGILLAMIVLAAVAVAFTKSSTGHDAVDRDFVRRHLEQVRDPVLEDGGIGGEPSVPKGDE